MRSFLHLDSWFWGMAYGIAGNLILKMLGLSPLGAVQAIAKLIGGML